MANYSQLIGEKINLCDGDLTNLYMAGLLHDIGKNMLDDRSIYQNKLLTESEFEVIKKHPLLGSKILKRDNFDHTIIDAVLFHHERIDGSGYYNLEGQDINLFSKIIAISDSFDAMTSFRAYNKIMTCEEALQEIKLNLGTQFDVKLGTIFIELMGEK